MTSKTVATFVNKFNHFTCLLQVKRDRGVERGVEVETPTMPGIHIIDSH